MVGLKHLPAALNVLWLVLVLPATFAEPIGLELRTNNGDGYLHAQLFTGFMYIGATICLWFLRAWKVQELDRISGRDSDSREIGLKDDDAVPHNAKERPQLCRQTSRAASVRSKGEQARGFWSWQRV